MEPSKATTLPVVERWASIMAKRMAIDSILGLQEITQYGNKSFKKTYPFKMHLWIYFNAGNNKTIENHLCRH